MSRSDYPPDYEESRGPLYGGNYPQPPPPYGFPGYGGPHPGQPSAPYPTDPNTPLYSGQPGGYPGGPYPGQPYQGGPGAGYPAPPPMPPMIPPTIPSDVLSSGEYFPHVSSWSLMNFAFLCRHHLIFFFFYLSAPTQATDSRHEEAVGTASASGTPSSERWSQGSVTPAFLRFPSLKSRVWILNLTVLARLSQVYLVLASQLIVTTAIVSVFTFVWVSSVYFVWLRPPRTCVTPLIVSLPQKTCWKIREGQPGALLGVIVRTHWLCFPLLFQFKH